MSTSVMLIAMILLYFTILLGITWFSQRRQGKGHDYSGYVIGNRKVGIAGICTSIAANARDGTGMAFWVAFAAMFGFGAVWVLAGFLLAFGLIALQAPKIRKEAEEQNYVTLDDMFRYRVGPRFGKVGATLIALTAFLYAAGNLYVAGALASNLFGIANTYGVVAAALFVGLYLWAGGYMNVIRTDLFQGALIFVFASAMLFVYDIPAPGEIVAQLGAFPADMKLGFFLLVGLFGYAAADQWQRLFSAKSPDVARHSFLVVLPFYALITSGVIVFGMAMHAQFPDVPPNELFFGLFAQETLSPIVIVMLGLFTLTAAMSTIDTQTFQFSATIMRTLGYDHESDRTKFVVTLRTVMAGLLVAMSLIAILIGDVVSYLVDVVTVFLVLAPILFYVVISKPRQDKFRDTALAVIAGSCAILHGILFFTGTFNEGILLNLIPAGLSALLTAALAAGLRFRKRTE